jgi:hypothetical protein
MQRAQGDPSGADDHRTADSDGDQRLDHHGGFRSGRCRPDHGASDALYARSESDSGKEGSPDASLPLGVRTVLVTNEVEEPASLRT